MLSVKCLQENFVSLGEIHNKIPPLEKLILQLVFLVLISKIRSNAGRDQHLHFAQYIILATRCQAESTIGNVLELWPGEDGKFFFL